MSFRALSTLALWFALASLVPAQRTRAVPGQYASIQAAIQAAGQGDTVLVSPGTYFETLDFLGKAIAVKSTDGPAVTAIDGQRRSSVVTFQRGEGASSVLDGFLLTHGDAGAGNGGAVRCVSSAPTIRDCWMRANRAASGGGIYLDKAASATVEGCRFEGNVATRYGGGLDAVQSTAVIRACAFRNNTATLDGGGLATFGGKVAVDRCGFVQNAAGDQGGGVSLNGGGSLTGCTAIRNRARYGGGVAAIGSNPITVAGCMIGENTASARGGGIDVASSAPTITNTTIADNQAAAGGGVGGTNAKPALTNTIVWGNQPAALTFAGTSSPVVTYCDVEGGFPGVGNFQRDPRFANSAGENYRLAAGSPCIAAGNNAAAGVPSRDIDGQPRISGSAIDIGADEFWSATGSFLDRHAPTDCRLLCYNVWANSIFPSVNRTQADRFERLINALDPDIICLQEVTSGSSQVRQLLNTIAPRPGSASWYVHTSGTDDVIASKYRLSLQATATVPAGDRRLAMALIDLPDAHFAHDLYAMNAHYKCCGGEANDPQRQQQSDALVSWMRDARSPGGFISLPTGTALMVMGDLNIVGAFQPVATLLSGDIIGESRYGQNSRPDWDGTVSVDLHPRHNGREDFDYTWRQDTSSYAPGRLDYVTYADSVTRTANAFILNTALMSAAELAAAGLQTGDVMRGSTAGDYDHLPIVVDLRATDGPIHSYGPPGGGLRSGWKGTSSIGTTLTIRLFGARPFEPVLYLAGPSRTAWGGVPLPLDLTFLGAPGCHLLAAPYIQTSLSADASGNTSTLFSIPNDIRLVGAKLFTQWAAIYSPNPADWRVSDALQVTGTR